MTPEEIFAVAVAYLQERGWHRDGDDAGIWLHATGTAWLQERRTFGVALQVQLERDGVGMLSIPPLADRGSDVTRFAPVPYPKHLADCDGEDRSPKARTI